MRLEVAASLARPGLKVVPVRVGGAAMPRAADLPEPLRLLARRHAHEISDIRWEFDVGQLVQALRRILTAQVEPARRVVPTDELAARNTVPLAPASRRGDPPGSAAGEPQGDRADPSAESHADAATAERQDAKQERQAPQKETVPPDTGGEGPVPETETVSRLDSSPPKAAHQARNRNAADKVAPAGSGSASVIEPEMIRIQGGTFLMGSPAFNLLLLRRGEARRDGDERHHQVRVEEFSIGKYPVTFDEYDRYCEVAGREMPGDKGWGRGKRPVINVSWRDAYDYAAWLRARTGKPYRLPTEAELEYAARAGTMTAYWWGDAFDAAKANTGSKTTPVGQYPANPWGLHDTAGNVWEWAGSVYSADYDGSELRLAKRDETGPRVMRGGSWYDEPDNLRAANRDWNSPDFRYDNIGFRLAQD